MKNKKFTSLKEERRFRSIQLYRKGWKQKDISEALGVSTRTIRQWMQKFRVQGKASLRSKKNVGAPPRLTMEEKYQILELLYPGAEAWGFYGDIWTCARIRTVIKRHFGVEYHRHHIAKIMKKLDWTSHKPIVRATQRNNKEIENWKNHKWPAIKKSQNRGKNHISPR